MSLEKCPVCNGPTQIRKNFDTLRPSFECFRCGSFRSDHYALIALKRVEWSEQQIATASGYIRRNEGLLLTSEEIERMTVLRAPSPAEKAERLLVSLGDQESQPGASLLVSGRNISDTVRWVNTSSPEELGGADIEDLKSLKWLAIASASNGDEVDWLLKNALIEEGFLKEGRMVSSGGRIHHSVVITPRGWREIERLKNINLGSRIGFVAMSFREEFIGLYDQGIAPGIAAAGYEAKRIDRTEHNNRIDDEIIASIKQSRFLLADFTIDRGGIYFEAGLGLGLGLPVIWLVREAEANEVHFDNRQYNFIRWREGEWDDLVKRLRYRIEATIGPGPLAKARAESPIGTPELTFLP